MSGSARIEELHTTFRRWLGAEYDLMALDAVLATAAAEQLDGDPPWLLVVSGSGNAKTETVAALAGVQAHITSTITSEGALLSATKRKERSGDATGGLLKAIGGRGLLVIKDFTSILSMNRDMRTQVLAALREVHDGRWERNVGTDGGHTITWEGRIVLIGAVTTAWDSAHSVVAAMGDRFALVRMDSAASTVRRIGGRQALRNVGAETEMRADLEGAVRGVLGDHGVNLHPGGLFDSEQEALLALADLVTHARTAVEYDYRGEVIAAHAPEMPTRFAKMLAQIVRGGLAICMTRDRALDIAARIAGDSMPPLRLEILGFLLAQPPATVAAVQKGLQRPRTTVDRGLQALHVLGLVTHEQDQENKVWRYRLSELVDQETLKALVTRNVSAGGLGDREKKDQHG